MIVTALQWIENALLGTLASVSAIIAVAGLGFLMLQGYLPRRRAVNVVIGCFLLFGANIIARSLVIIVNRDTPRLAPADPLSPSLPEADPPSMDDNANVNIG